MRIDIGCGKNKREDGIWIGIDLYPYPDVDIVSDVFEFLEEIENESISEANMSHFFEHLEVNERISIMNTIYRKMKGGAGLHVESPDALCDSAYGDPTHKWPPISPWTFFYMNKEWREKTASYVGYLCDFKVENLRKENRKNTVVVCVDLIK